MPTRPSVVRCWSRAGRRSEGGWADVGSLCFGSRFGETHFLALRRGSRRGGSVQSDCVSFEAQANPPGAAALHRRDGSLRHEALLGPYGARLWTEVRLIPPIYEKPFVKRQKNDAADATAIA